ncbi:MAG: SDR family oxidoreductase [Burkholderiales bacterium]|nr:SDR family oxidoreductase [Burkholderiales bacterium]
MPDSDPTPPVVVLTGASSGIGRATAHRLSARGADVVLAARNLHTLRTVADECLARGARVLVVPTDVSDADAVAALARLAIERFGRIDVWINNVGVGAVGLFDEVPLALHRRVIESNLIGHMNGAHAALAHFRERRRGTLINMISLGGWVPSPYAAAYSASKFGLRGFTESIRAEMSALPDVHVCAVCPTFVDTPGVGHGANRVGRHLSPPSPMLDPREVADVVVGLIDSPRPTVMVGAVAAPARVAHAVAPELTGRIGRRAMEKALERAGPADVGNGNLFEPSGDTAIDGGYRRGWRLPVGKLALGAAVALGVGLLASRAVRGRTSGGPSFH